MGSFVAEVRCLFIVGLFGLSVGEHSMPSPGTAASAMINWDRLQVVDYLRSGALLVAFLAVLVSDIRGRHKVRGRAHNMWVNAEVVSFFLSGLATFFFPQTFLEYVSKTSLNYMHMFAIQVAGCSLVGAAVATARQQRSLESDPVVHSSWLLSRLVASGTISIFLLRSHLQLDFFTEQNATFVLLGALLWFLGCFCQMFVGNKLTSPGIYHSLTSGIDFYLMLDVVITMMIGLTHMTNPNYFLSTFVNIKADDFNIHLVQTMFLLEVSLNMRSFGTFYYLTDDDKRHILFGRLMTMCMFVPVFALTQWKHSMLRQNILIVFSIFVAIRFAICLRGYLIQDRKSKTV